MRQVELVVACVSDEYAKSRMCQLEFRFASIVLKLPVVVAVLGTGQEWERTEVGMLSTNLSKVNLFVLYSLVHTNLSTCKVTGER